MGPGRLDGPPLIGVFPDQQPTLHRPSLQNYYVLCSVSPLFSLPPPPPLFPPTPLFLSGGRSGQRSFAGPSVLVGTRKVSTEIRGSLSGPVFPPVHNDPHIPIGDVNPLGDGGGDGDVALGELGGRDGGADP